MPESDTGAPALPVAQGDTLPPGTEDPQSLLPAPPETSFALTSTFSFDDVPQDTPSTALVPLTPTLAFEVVSTPPVAPSDAPVRPRYRLLIVDDDAATVALVRHRLVREGFEVDDCAEGDDALRRAFDEPGYDLILANTLLAGLDGFGILRHIRASGLPTHVVLMGHQGDEQAVVRAFAMGAQDFIPKPFSPIELLARLLRVLALPRG